MHLVMFERRGPDGAELASRQERVGSMSDAALGFETLEGVAQGARRIGALLTRGAHAGNVVDLNRALAIKLAYDDVAAARR